MINQATPEHLSTNNSFTLGWPDIAKSHNGVLIHRRKEATRAAHGTSTRQRPTRMSPAERERHETRHQSLGRSLTRRYHRKNALRRAANDHPLHHPRRRNRNPAGQDV